MNSECSICFELIRSSDTHKPFVTRCGHLFHEKCINNCLQKQSKCPQCNQKVSTSQLIRLFINEPELSVRAKDDLIHQLKGQLTELNEKAQLQYDLIGALNRQICLEKELSQKEKDMGSRQSVAPVLRPSRFDAPQRIVAPAKLKARSTRESTASAFSNFSTVAQADKPKFTFGRTHSTEWDTLGACGVSSSPTSPDSLTKSKTETERYVAKFSNWDVGAQGNSLPDTSLKGLQRESGNTQNKPSFTFTFGSNGTFGSGSGSGSGANGFAAWNPTAASGENKNLFAPTTKDTTKAFVKHMLSPSAKPSSTERRRSSSSFDNVRSLGELTTLEQFFQSLQKTPTSGGSAPPVFGVPSVAALNEASNNAVVGVEEVSKEKEDIQSFNEMTTIEQFFQSLPRLGGSAPVFGVPSVPAVNEASNNAVVKVEKVSPEKED